MLKLQRAGVNGKIYELIRSMHQHSISRVKCKNTLTDSIDIKQGVHQGNNLSPPLFNIFIYDIGNTLLTDPHLFCMILRLTICYMLMIWCYFQPQKRDFREILIGCVNIIQTGV